MARCPHCDAQLDSRAICRACGRLLAIPDSATPFELLGLEPAFRVEHDDLRRRLLKSSREVHPDFFATAGDEARALAEANSARLNEAYAVLSDDVARADWLVQHLGGPDEQTERAMPQPFLVEVLEWNEMLEEARAGARSSSQLDQLERDLLARRNAALGVVSQALSPLPARGAPELKRVRTELNAVRYVDRALSELGSLRLARAAQR